MKIDRIFDLKTYYGIVQDDQEGDQMVVLGLVPQLARVLVIQKARVEAAQSGRSPFAVLPKELEKDFLRRVAPDLLPEEKAKAAPGEKEKEKGGGGVTDEVGPTVGVPDALKG